MKYQKLRTPPRKRHPLQIKHQISRLHLMQNKEQEHDDDDENDDEEEEEKEEDKSSIP